MAAEVQLSGSPKQIDWQGAGATRCAVVHPLLRRRGRGEAGRRSPEAALAEAEGLAEAIDLEVAWSAIIGMERVNPATYFGKGNVERIAREVKDKSLDLVVVDCALGPVQQRNLERDISCKVIDRTGLILEIFGARAHTKEGVLQVELAHLTYQQSRLVRSWTHLERQRGGFGFLGGPGETQIETDRRLLRDRIAKLKRELEQVRRTRGLHRRRRQAAPYPVVALVGYTNAGKSTLFNHMAAAAVDARDMLFATLDPTTRQVDLGTDHKVLMSDTVGFISNLPTQLVAAFRATLEEIEEADLILHVRDGAHPDSEAQRQDVIKVLNDIHIAKGEGPPVVEVINKIDLMPPAAREAALLQSESRQDIFAVSALTGEGIDRLRQAIDKKLFSGDDIIDLELDAGEGAALAWLYRHGHVLERHNRNGAIALKVRLSHRDFERWRKSRHSPSP